MMRDPEWPVTESSSLGNNIHVRIVIRLIVAYLLQAAQRRKVADRIGEDHVALQRQAGRQSHHVLFSDAGIHVLARKPPSETIQHAESEIARHEDDPLVRLREQFESLNKGGPHTLSSSLSAARNSSSRAVR